MRLSVIVPLAKGETEWPGLVAQLAGVLDADCELILVAAGEPVAVRSPTRSIGGPAGRARQMNQGAGEARGRWLWFLHADSRLSPGCWPALRRFIADDRARLGWFDLAFRDDGPRRVAWNACGANLRSHLLRIPFGDQGFVVPAATFAALGGFDVGAAYGEDHIFVWTARRAGIDVVPVGATLSTSARKYAVRGWAETTLRHVGLTVRQAWPLWRAWRRERRR